MCALDVGRIRSPSSSFETWCIEKCIVDGDEALANTILDGIQVVGTKLIGNKTSRRIVSRELPSVAYGGA